MPQPDRKCASYSQKNSQLPRISLANLSGAFILLLVGWSVAFLAFLVEKIVYYHKLNRAIAVTSVIKPRMQPPAATQVKVIKQEMQPTPAAATNIKVIKPKMKLLTIKK